MTCVRALVACAILGGCSIDAAVARQAIQGGVSDTTSSAVVGIVDSSSGASCTGSLIAPNLVLTAQHCVAPIVGIPTCADDGRFGPPEAAGNFYVTTRPTLMAAPTEFRRVAEVVIPPGGDLFCARDIALLVISANVPSTEATPIAPRLDPAPSVSELYAAVGFGAVDDMGTGAGERRRREGLAVSCVGAVECGAGTPDGEWIGETGVCGGDSGGPAIDASGEVIGVASRGTVGCGFPTYTALGSWAAWMRTEGARAATRGGYAAPAWVGAGPAIDAGVAIDAAVVTDAGAPNDAAAAIDAAAPDAAPAVDAASAPPATGGGCSVARGDHHLGLGVALGLALAALSRRSRRRP